MPNPEDYVGEVHAVFPVDPARGRSLPFVLDLIKLSSGVVTHAELQDAPEETLRFNRTIRELTTRRQPSPLVAPQIKPLVSRPQLPKPAQPPSRLVRVDVQPSITTLPTSAYQITKAEFDSEARSRHPVSKMNHFTIWWKQGLRASHGYDPYYAYAPKSVPDGISEETLDLEHVLARYIRRVEAGEICRSGFGMQQWDLYAEIINERMGETSSGPIMLPWMADIHAVYLASHNETVRRSAAERLESRYQAREAVAIGKSLDASTAARPPLPLS